VLGAVLVTSLKFWLSAIMPSVWPFILAGTTLLITVGLKNGLVSAGSLLPRKRGESV
jgi:urea transport system permease protein